MSAPFLGYIPIHIKQDHRVAKVLPGARIQHQHGVMSCGAWEQILLPPGAFPIQHRGDAVSSPGFGLKHPRSGVVGVRKYGQNFVGVACNSLNVNFWNKQIRSTTKNNNNKR